ncbi:MAG: glycosyltransferase [Paludibacter sp.]|nr:glycosyltransferase [Paludibacter sp.]
MFISIIIPTYNRAHLIGITLESLLKLNYPKEMFEILAVDNNSSDTTASVLRDWELKSNGIIKYYYEPRQGSHFARNGVVKHAKGSLLYFTDDDMIADENMLVELATIFIDNNLVGTATGCVLPNWEKEPPAWIKKYFTNGWLSLLDREEELLVSPDDFGVFSCHQAVLKDVFIKAGGYNPDIVQGEWLGDNETGLNIKIKALGYQFAFVKKSVTHHIIPKTRMTQQYFNKRFANQGNCDSYTDFRKHDYATVELKKNIIKFRKLKIQKYLKYFILYVLQHDKWRVNRAWVDYYKHRMLYDKKLLTDKEWVKMVLINDWIN